MKPLLISSGEPAGIGPDLCLSLAQSNRPVVILGDIDVLEDRAKSLNLPVPLVEYQQGVSPRKNVLTVLSIPCPEKVVPGHLNIKNAKYVLTLLEAGASRCLSQEFSALVTAPIHKGIINQAGYAFSGHTEYFAELTEVESPVMMLASDTMRVALVTTHLPLKDVPLAITPSLLTNVIKEVNSALKIDFGVSNPKIYVAGLNPHAGEGGYLGDEEVRIIIPTIDLLRQQGINLFGPFPADTMFIPENNHHCDVYLAMYHDQGLSVLKYASFGAAVNITLGLPFIRTSVDHGTALHLAGIGKASSKSLKLAIEMAASIYHHRQGIYHDPY